MKKLILMVSIITLVLWGCGGMSEKEKQALRQMRIDNYSRNCVDTFGYERGTSDFKNCVLSLYQSEAAARDRTRHAIAANNDRWYNAYKEKSQRRREKAREKNQSW